MTENSKYNEYLNSSDIVLGMSGGEGWGLPEFHSVCLGKHAVILNAHGYKDWASNDTCVMVEPSENKIEAEDGVFFTKGSLFNQGNIFSWDEKDFIEGCHNAISRTKENRLNTKGIELQDKFTYAKTLDTILELM